MNISETKRKLIALSLIDKMGPRTYAAYKDVFGDVQGIFAASDTQLAQMTGKTKIDYQSFRDKAVFEKADEAIGLCEKHGIHVYVQSDEEYPASLKEIYDPPITLFVKGRLPEESKPRIAVVGSRACSQYGRRMTEEISRDLSMAGAVVVSGLALGIDAAAHEATVKAGGQTIAVLGGGHLKMYPKENARLAEKIVLSGAVISEYAPQIDPKAQFFPIRNRIISGLSLAVFVAEARLKSGALITVDTALDQGREVYALPGNADASRSSGTNELLKQGAKMVTSAADILEDLRLTAIAISPSASVQNESEALSEEQQKIWEIIEDDPLHMDEVVAASGFPLPKVMKILSYLEMSHKIRQLPGKYFERIDR